MKLFKITSFAAIVTVFAGGALTSCSSDPEYDETQTIAVSQGNFTYDSEGVWIDNDNPGFVSINDFEFSHSVDSYGMVYGFTPSKASDTALHTPMYSYPYASAFGGGVSGPGSTYLVGYWGEFLENENSDFNERTCRIWQEDLDTFKPLSVKVCCNTYLYYAVLNGTDFSSKFGPGDWVTLTAHGVHLDGTESEATIYLVNIESSNVESGILTAWEDFDLSGLGACTGIYFTMDSSDKGTYGINIPTYFCLDQLVLKD